MKTVITFIFLSLLTIASAITSEYSLMIFKNTQEQSLSTKFSFYYGWIEKEGEKHFFIQENHITHAQIQEAGLSPKPNQLEIDRVLEKSLQSACNQCKLISYKQANVYESLKAVKYAKKKLLAKKKNVLKIIFI